MQLIWSSEWSISWIYHVMTSRGMFHCFPDIIIQMILVPVWWILPISRFKLMVSWYCELNPLLICDISRDPSKGGLPCIFLSLRSSPIEDLKLSGFNQLHTLNLDFCTSLTSLQKDCFSCLPNLMRLSMCETRISNLWTTSAALSKLPSLVELRFQNCLCCEGTGPCSMSPSGIEDRVAAERFGSGIWMTFLHNQALPVFIFYK